jgi:soluble lytic murein transglycosylase-like protein
MARHARPWLALILAAHQGTAVAAGAPVCEQEMTRAAVSVGIPLNVLFSVALTETGRKGALNPFEMNVDGRAVHSNSREEALARFAFEREHGARLIDIGCMQINHHWHGAHFSSVGEMFDPARNVLYAANYLRALKEQEGTWTLAVARYNAGPGNPGAQKRYVCSVIGNMVASGFGEWTANAHAFCR